MDIKKILESIDNVEEGMPMAPPTPPMPQDDGDPVSMNVNLSARGKEHVADLMAMMKNAGIGDQPEPSMPMPGPRLDMERLKDIIDGPKDKDELKPGLQKEPCPKCGKVHLGQSGCAEELDNTDEPVAEYDNEPEEQYSDHHTMVNDLSGGLNRKKKMYAKAQDGDNAMAVESIKEQLYKALMAKMAEGRGRGKKKDKKTTEGRGKLMAGRGKGKLMAGRGRGKKH